MRIVPNTKLRRPRFTWNIVDINGDSIIDVTGKRLVSLEDAQNINTEFRTTGRPNDWTWEDIPLSITRENINANWDWLLQKNTLRRPRFTYTLLDVNWDRIVDVNWKVLMFLKDEQNINTIWR